MPAKAPQSKRPRSGKSKAKPNIRSLSGADLDGVVAIDRLQEGRSRKAFYQKRLAHLDRDPAAFIALAAELEGRLVGFAIARLYEGEYGAAAPEAALDTIGVAADVRGSGIGRRLLDGVAAAMRAKGITEMSTRTDWAKSDVMSFFAGTGFALAPRVVLERSLGELME